MFIVYFILQKYGMYPLATRFESCKIRHAHRHSEEIDHTNISTLTSHHIKILKFYSSSQGITSHHIKILKFYSSSQGVTRLRKTAVVVYLYSCSFLQQSCDWIHIHIFIFQQRNSR